MKQVNLKHLMVATMLLLTYSMTAQDQEQQDFNGKWNGTLEVKQVQFSVNITLTLEQNEKGINAFLDIPEQGLNGYEAKASLKGGKLTVGFPEMYATYNATLRGDTLDGKFTQMGYDLPLVMVRQRARVSNDDDDWVNDSLLSVFDNIQLKDVTVTAQRQLIKQDVDRIGYSVADDADSKTNNVLTMLRKVPLVSVDGQDEIRVNGQTNFRIFRNGHPDPSLEHNAKDLLKAMPASSVKRIEVITDPGAKYDAEGTSVILNIVMNDKTSLKGVSGMATAMATHMGDAMGSLNLTTQVSNVVMSVDYGITHGGSHSQKVTSKSLSHYEESGADLLGDSFMKTDHVTMQFGNLNASWEPDTLNLVSLSVGGYAWDMKGLGTNSSAMRDLAGQTLYSYNSNSNSSSDNYNVDGRLDYQRRTGLKGETITLSYMLSALHNKEKDNSVYSELFNMPVPYTGINQEGKEDFNEHTLQLDWTRPLAKKHTIETGAKYIYRLNRSHNMLNYVGIETDTDLRFKHLTQVGAAYLSYTFHSGSWDARAGLRYEHSYLRASYPGGEQEAFDAHLNDVVPSASVRYQFDFANSLKLSYAASIKRPSINYLNPTVVESPMSRSFGNPDLGSTHNHSLSMTYMHIGAKLTFNITPQFQFSNNGIGDVKWTEGLVQVSTYANTLRTLSSSVSGFVQWMLTQKTNLVFNGSIAYTNYKSRELDLENNRISGSFFANVTQYLPWKLQLTGFASLWGGYVGDLYSHMGTSFWHGLSLQRSFLNEDRLTVQLIAVNPIGGKHTTFKYYTDHGDVTGWSDSRRVARQFVLSVSYRFGSLKSSVKKASKTIENDDLLDSGKKSAGSDNVTGGGMGR